MSRNANEWLSFRPSDDGIHSVDHIDRSLAYLAYKSGIIDLHRLLELIQLSWDFSFARQKEFVPHVGDYLKRVGRITDLTSRSDALFEFDELVPDRVTPILRDSIVIHVVAIYLEYLRHILTLILVAHPDRYPKKILADLGDLSRHSDMDDMIVFAAKPEIEALAFANYPNLKKKLVSLQIYPSSKNRDLAKLERYIGMRNEMVHFHPGTAFISGKAIRRLPSVHERTMWAVIGAFSRVVNYVEKNASKRYKLWTGFIDWTDTETRCRDLPTSPLTSSRLRKFAQCSRHCSMPQLNVSLPRASKLG